MTNTTAFNSKQNSPQNAQQLSAESVEDNDTASDSLEQTQAQEKDKIFLRLFNKGLTFQINKQYEQAIEFYEKALSVQDNHLPTHQVLGYLYQDDSRFKEALYHYKKAINLHEHSATLQNSAGLCEERCKNLPAARQHYLTASTLKVDNAEALNNLGNVCRKMGDYENAEMYLLRALRVNISVATLANLGVMMGELGKHPLALSFYEHALRLQPDNPQLRWNKSIVLLSMGRFDEGWFLYDQGKIAKTRPKQQSPHIKDKANYNIEYFRNKTIYIKGEQGIGDEVMFASCIPELIAISKRCIIECDDRLVPLFQRSFPDALVMPEYDSKPGLSNKNMENADIAISMGSIPRFTRRKFTDFPRNKAYLFAYPKAVTHWRKRYEEKGKTLNVGITWKGGINDEARRRSTSLAAWKNILTLDDVNFINLQYGDVSQDAEMVERYLNDWPDTDHFHNIEQLAAQISALDLLITVSNVTAHLAGALGVPVYILLPKSPNWRWFKGKNPSPWYNSATLFAQTSPDEWNSLFQRIEETLLEEFSEAEET